MEIKTSGGPGAIPLGATLMHTTHWLEMEPEHPPDGLPAHPMTISLPQETVDRLNAYGHKGPWTLTAAEGDTVTIEPILPRDNTQGG